MELGFETLSRAEARLVLRLWLPLALTWLMMSLEGPIAIAFISRLSEPTSNLAAFSIALSIAFFVESPIMMLLSAGAALVTDRRRYEQLFRFAAGLNGFLSLMMFVLGLPPVFARLNGVLWGLSPALGELVRGAIWLLVPWPAAIGFRRLWQGVLIRAGRSRQISFATVVRLAAMSGAGLLGSLWAKQGGTLPGVWVGAVALSAGVVAEAIAVRWWAGPYLRSLSPQPRAAVLSLREIWAFYVPLLLTALVHVALSPLLTLFMAKGYMAIPSLAAYPAVTNTAFLFGCLGVAYQEVVVVLEGTRARSVLGPFAAAIALGSGLGLALIAWVPLLTSAWVDWAFSLPAGVAPLAYRGLKVATLFPALTAFLAYYKGRFIHYHATRQNLITSIIEVGLALCGTAGLIGCLGWPALDGAVVGLLVGRLAAFGWARRWRR